MRVLVVQTRQEQMMVREHEQEIIFDLVIINHYHHLRYIDGMRIKEVFITPDVLTNGLDERLFDRLFTTLVSMSVDPMYAFRIFYSRKET